MPSCEASGLSEFFSTVSLVSWICAQLPQIISNYKNKTAEGISPLFLLLWFMGDFLSFTSCLLNDAALNFQIYLSLFFLANDITLCTQYYYYVSVYPRRRYLRVANHISREDNTIDRRGADTKTTAIDIHSVPDLKGANGEPTSFSSLSSSEAKSFGSMEQTASVGQILATSAVINAGVTNAFSTEVTILTASTSKTEVLALVLAWACTCVYVCSRCPQLYKNYKRKSVDGISPLLFGSALVGNLTYTISVLTSCEFLSAPNKSEFFWKQLPYLIGSSGTIVFDAAYFYQRYLYRFAGRDSMVIGLQPWLDAA